MRTDNGKKDSTPPASSQDDLPVELTEDEKAMLNNPLFDLVIALAGLRSLIPTMGEPMRQKALSLIERIKATPVKDYTEAQREGLTREARRLMAEALRDYGRSVGVTFRLKSENGEISLEMVDTEADAFTLTGYTPAKQKNKGGRPKRQETKKRESELLQLARAEKIYPILAPAIQKDIEEIKMKGVGYKLRTLVGIGLAAGINRDGPYDKSVGKRTIQLTPGQTARKRKQEIKFEVKIDEAKKAITGNELQMWWKIEELYRISPGDTMILFVDEYARERGYRIDPQKMETHEEQEAENARADNQFFKAREDFKAELKGLSEKRTSFSVPFKMIGKKTVKGLYSTPLVTFRPEAGGPREFLIFGLDSPMQAYLNSCKPMCYPKAIYKIDGKKTTTLQIADALMNYASMDGNTHKEGMMYYVTLGAIYEKTSLKSAAHYGKKWREKRQKPLIQALGELTFDYNTLDEEKDMQWKITLPKNWKNRNDDPYSLPPEAWDKCLLYFRIPSLEAVNPERRALAVAAYKERQEKFAALVEQEKAKAIAKKELKDGGMADK